MSLYIGNLSPQVGKDELEHAFGRFGRCDIRLKDGYGFAIYGIRAQAEVALRALRGRNICGLPISLSWSNKQPNGPQSFNRGGRPHEMQTGRGFGRRDDHMNGPSRSNARQPYKFRQREGDTEKLESELPVEKETTDPVSEDQEADIKKEDGQDRIDNADHNMLDSGRWGQFGRLSHDSRIEDGTTFDRYEPDREYEKTGEEGGNRLLNDLSAGKEISEDKSKREEAVDVASRHQNIPRKNQACFKCGNLDHKMRDCPLQDVSRVRKLTHSDDRRGRVMTSRRTGRIDPDEVDLPSRRRLSSTSTKERVRGRKDSGSGRRHQRVKRRRDSPVSSGYSGRRKQSEDETENFRHRRHGKRTRRSLSSSRSQTSSSSSSTSRSSLSARLISKNNKLNTRLETSRSPTSQLNKAEVSLNGYVDISTSLQTNPDVVMENKNSRVVVQGDNIDSGNIGAKNQQLDVVSKEENDSSGETRVAVQEENLVVSADVKDAYKIDESYMNDDGYNIEPEIADGIYEHKASLEDEKSELQTLTYTTRTNYGSISLDELDRVMKHYNMKHSEDNEDHSSIEDYFGGARFWPWEIIFYRRLKKGPISTENYARRLEQNKEFGITDKYVRSSSGWGEPIQEP